MKDDPRTKPKINEKDKIGKGIITASEISDDCIPYVITLIFDQAKRDLKHEILFLQSLDMKEVQAMFDKKRSGEALTKDEVGLNLSYVAHFRQMMEIEEFFTSDWAKDLGVFDGEVLVREVDEECGYKSAKERRKAFAITGGRKGLRRAKTPVFSGKPIEGDEK